MLWNETASERQRHGRAALYVCLSLALALLGNLLLGFDRAQTVGYAVTAYVLLNVLNYRAMFGRPVDRKDGAELEG